LFARLETEVATTGYVHDNYRTVWTYLIQLPVEWVDIIVSQRKVQTSSEMLEKELACGSVISDMSQSGDYETQNTQPDKWTS
jgi:hypothetical protein